MRKIIKHKRAVASTEDRHSAGPWYVRKAVFQAEMQAAQNARTLRFRPGFPETDHMIHALFGCLHMT